MDEEIKKGLDDCYDSIEKENKEILGQVKKILTKYRYKKIIEFLDGDEGDEEGCGEYTLHGIVGKDRIFGEKQKEHYWFKHIFITQSNGYSGDDYSGTIFIPLNKEKFLRFYYEC